MGAIAWLPANAADVNKVAAKLIDVIILIMEMLLTLSNFSISLTLRSTQLERLPDLIIFD
jgi:hypothetical protein